MLTTRAVSEIMSRPVFIDSAARVDRALRVLEESRSEHLLVLEGDHVAGIVCSCDLAAARPDDTVGSRMQSPVVAVQGGTTLEDAAALMRTRSVGSIPVLGGGLVLGILSRGDLVRSGFPPERTGQPCATCGEQHHVTTRTGAPFCAECLECARAPRETGDVD